MRKLFHQIYVIIGLFLNCIRLLFWRIRDKLYKPTDKILFVAHPDDDTLFFHTFIKEHKPYVVLLTDGWSIRRYASFKKVMKFYGVKYRAYNLKSKDKRVDLLEKYVKEVINLIKPTLCATHNLEGEYGHEMHKRVYSAVKKIVNCKLLVPENDLNIENYPLDRDILNEKVQIFKKYYTTEMFVLDMYSKWVRNEKLVLEAKNEKINCAVVSSYFGPYYSNFVASLVAFKNKMLHNGNNVIFVFPKETEQFEWISLLEDCKIYFLDYKPNSINNFLTLRKIFKNEKINLIYSHMCGWDLTTRIAAPFTPVIWHMRMNVNVENRIKRIKNWIKFRILGFGKTYHIAVSEPVTTAINSLKPRNKCVTIHNCLDFSRLKPVGVKEEAPLKKILIFGWQPHVKGLDIALDACEKIAAENKFKLLVSAQSKTYEYIAERYQTQPEWLELLEPTSDVAQLYSNADIMLSASRSEGFSFALAEAIYSGLITIVSDIAGTSWSKEFSARFEFQSGNAEALAEALKEACNYYITAEEQENNRNILETKYSMESWVESVYKEINLIFNK